MKIRKTTTADLPRVMEIYATSREYMRQNGNPTQWFYEGEDYPPQHLIEGDIERGVGYVCESEGEVVAVFYFAIESDPTYSYIDGAWLNDEPYGVVHRIARSANGSGSGEFCLNWCFEQCGNVRIDTHSNNKSMIERLIKLGYKSCGTIYLPDGAERLAFQAYQKAGEKI